jgi:cytochrome P450
VLRAGSTALVQGETEGGGAERADRLEAFGELIARQVAQRRRDPQDDLISQLIRAEEAGDRLSEPELFSMIGLLVVAGHETTSSLIGSGTLALLDCPDQLARLRADPGLVPAAVEELLRLTGPNLFTPVPRLVTYDVEVGGRQLRQGDVVIPLLAAANHDETQFADPATLDVARRIQRHVAFGHGIHTCLGAPLARLEGDIAFTTLLRRLPGLRIAVPREAITVHGMRDVRGLTSLPVVF